MPGSRRIYLPSWVAWLAQSVVLPFWIWLSYAAGLSDSTHAVIGFGDWLVSSYVLAVLSLYLFLIGYRKIPAFLAPGNE